MPARRSRTSIPLPTAPLRGWVLGANSNLPPDIAVNWAMEVEPAFHARYTAQGRTYRYCILRRATRPAILRDRVCWTRATLDAAGHARGRAGACRRARLLVVPRRGMPVHDGQAARRLDLGQADGPLVVLEISANSYLHHMVRNIVGTLMEVGGGKSPPAWVAEILAARDRTRAGITAPAGGLYLWQVRYPKSLQVPETASNRPWAMIAGLAGD